MTYSYQKQRSHTWRMLGVVFLLLVAVPLAELWVIVQVAGQIGFLWTIASMLLISAAGAWLLKQQGVATWRRLQAVVARGEVPASEVVDGALILFGGALLLTPGFLTDAVGLLFLLPPTRAAWKRAARRFFRRVSRRRLGVVGEVSDRVYEARAGDARRRRRRSSTRENPRGSDDGPGEELSPPGGGAHGPPPS